jgi:DNA mismatch repair ATPase MutS
MMDLNVLYKNLVDEYSLNIVSLKKQLFWVATIRLIMFASLLTSIYLLLHTGNFYWGIASLVFITGFLYLVKQSARLNAQKLLNEHLLFINQNELNVLTGLPNQFYNGSMEESGDHYYTDLDIFGANSLYHLFNRASTQAGKASLTTLLKNSYTEPQKIIQIQDAIKALSRQLKARQHICAEALAIQDFATERPLLSWVAEPGIIYKNTYLQKASFILPVINFIALLASIYIGQYYLLSLSVLISWFHVGSIGKYVNAQSMKLGKKQEILEAFASILKEWNKVDVTDALHLQQLQHQTLQANLAIQKLSRLVNLLDQRLNVLVNILLNSFLLYDIHCITSLEKWKMANHNNLPIWIDCIGQVESLVSLSTYAFNNAENVYPALSREKVCIESSGLYHPLIPIKENVSNDVSIGIQNRILLITGSNMSGKTTYLRTVGINILMAQCGLPVCAASFLFYPLQIYSSIRITDSLQEHTSYFMAELKRLQQIIQSIQNGKPGLILIDEILRGTNSDDKYHGSEEFVKKLVQHHTLTLFATHDLKLSELENEYPGVIKNYCFESIINNGELIFDYKILPGVAKNRNASFLMKKMGII